MKFDKSVDGVLGIRTLNRSFVDADELTELWRFPEVDHATKST